MDAAIKQTVLAFPSTREEIMDHNYSPQQQQRHALLTVFLTVLALMFFGLVLIVIGNGLVEAVVLIGGGMFLLGMFHYLLWGRALSQETAGEREEEQLRQRAAEVESEENWHPPDTRIRR
jgi:fatty acid desaturase